MKRALFLVLIVGACAERGRRVVDVKERAPEKVQLPTGNWLDPATASTSLGSMPLAIATSPRGDKVIVQLSGWREQGIQILDRRSGRVVQTIELPASFVGAAFSASGDTLFVSGGVGDVIYELVWQDERAKLAGKIPLGKYVGPRGGIYYSAGLALSPNGKQLYVAENLSDSLAVVDIGQQGVIQRLPVGRYPYAVAVSRDGTVFASAWGGNTVSIFAPAGSGLTKVRNVDAGRHPSALLLDRAQSRLFIASASTDRVLVLDARSGAKIAELRDPPPNGPDEGSTPNALALSEDGTRLFVAEADNNAVAVFALSAGTSAVASARGQDRLVGRVPVEWYPTALVTLGDTLLVVSGKGRGSAPNPDGPTPYNSREQHMRSYTLGQLDGSLIRLPLSSLTTGALTSYTMRVAAANRWNVSRQARASYPPFEHVIYIIKENRTYDEVLGDLGRGDGDSALVLFGRGNAPNHHALAERFGVFDRFFVNAEVSADGHNWSTAAYATDYVEKTVASNYSSRGRTYDYEGTNRGHMVDDDVNEPALGYLWDLAKRSHITMRNYGEFVSRRRSNDVVRYVANKNDLDTYTNHEFPGFDLDIEDQHRADLWIDELRQFSREGRMPQLEIVRLPNDHTAGLKGGAPTPRAYLADNDLAFGRMIDALSRSPFWKNTVVFVLEDDAQNGPDHIDSHRSLLYVISPYNQAGVYHRFVNTTDVVATIAEILKLGSLSQFDFYGRPLRDIWVAKPSLPPYTALIPGVPLTGRNPKGGEGAEQSRRLDLSSEDRADEDLFNKVLWRALKGESVPYPGVRRASVLEVRRAQ